jgi:hypothetical protein
MHIVNQAMEVEKIPTDLPRIKVVAVRALDQEYGTTPDAMLQIERFVLDYYKEEFPEVYENRGYDLARAIFEIQNIFQRTIFPEMGASWATYPDNIGHRDYPGCFRCHNDRMESESGKTIFTTCNKCHLILAQGPDISRVAVDLEEGLTFQHPGEDGEDIEEYTECTDCHTGGSAVYD